MDTNEVHSEVENEAESAYWSQPISVWLKGAKEARRKNRILDMTAAVQLSDKAAAAATSASNFVSTLRADKPTRSELAVRIGRSEKSVYEDWPGLVSQRGGPADRLLQDVVIRSAQRYFLELALDGWREEIKQLHPRSDERLLSLITVAARFGVVYPGIVIWANLPLRASDPAIQAAVAACELRSRTYRSNELLCAAVVEILNGALTQGAARKTGVIAIRNSVLDQIEGLQLIDGGLSAQVMELQRSLAALINDYGERLATESAGLEYDLRMTLAFLESARKS